MSAVLVAGAIAFAGLLPTPMDRAVAAPASAPVGTVQVRPADTLWSIAARHRVPGDSLPQAVDRIRSLNSAAALRMRPGSVLLVPAEPQANEVCQESAASAPAR